MDSERKAKRQSRLIIISEALMVVTVAITVLILAFVVSGYWLNSDFKVERQGLLQVSSYPTGADLIIDGEGSWLQRTNASKVLTVGQHSLTLTKEGYDTWSKDIEMREGLLYRISYPRLFLTERESTKVWTLPENPQFVTVSPNQKNLLVVSEDAGWQLIDLEREKLEPKVLKVELSGEIVSGDWAADNERILLQLKTEKGREWVLLNTKNVSVKINLTEEFSVDFSEIKILDDSANTLIAVVDDGLRRIDVSGRSLSSVLIPKVSSFDYRNETVVYAAESALGDASLKTSAAAGATSVFSSNSEQTSENEAALDDTGKYYVGMLNLSDGRSDILLKGFELPPGVLISRFYDEDYLSVAERGQDTATLKVYKKEDLALFYEGIISFTPERMKVGHSGEFILLNTGGKMATLDMEAVKVSEFSLEAQEFGWFSRGMIYEVPPSSDLAVSDLDGTNRRVLATGVNSALPVALSREKWLYYFDLEGDLIREEVAK